MDLATSGAQRLIAMGYTLKDSTIHMEGCDPLYFHVMTRFESAGILGVVAICGAASYWVTPTLMQCKMARRPGFHKIWYHPDSSLLRGDLGAMTYVLDPETGFPISKGFHTLTIGTEGLIGTTASVREKVEFMPPNTGLDTFHQRHGRYAR